MPSFDFIVFFLALKELNSTSSLLSSIYIENAINFSEDKACKKIRIIFLDRLLKLLKEPVAGCYNENGSVFLEALVRGSVLNCVERSMKPSPVPH
jgi:hypothetical protein